MIDKYANLTALTEFLSKVQAWANDLFATKASLSTVAFSGDYDDLSDKPTIPTTFTGTQGNISVNGTATGSCSGGGVTLNTTTVNSITDVGTLPSATMPTYSVSNETLTITAGSFNAGTLPTKGFDTTVKTGDAAYQSTQPTFTGDAVRLVTGNIAVPTSASFSGNEGNISVSGTPTGTNSQPTFTGNEATITVS